MQDIYLRSAMALGENYPEKLANKHILILGLGGVGSYVCEALARIGIGNLYICDHDIVSKSNLNRQLCALNSTIGQKKADIIKNRILDINPECKVTIFPIFYSEETAKLFWIRKYDYVIDAIDTVTSKKHLIKSVIDLKMPIISSLGTGNKLDPSKFSIVNIKKTSVCPLARVMRKELKALGIENHTVLFSTEKPKIPISLDKLPPGKRSVPSSVPWVPSCAGLMIAGYVVLELLNNE